MNVGCIPKKLMHQTALLSTAMQDARKYGWEYGEMGEARWRHGTPTGFAAFLFWVSLAMANKHNGATSWHDCFWGSEKLW